MKYDFTKCNNLNFKAKDGTTGYIKVVKNPIRFYLYLDVYKDSNFNTVLQIPTNNLNLVFGSLTEFKNWAIINKLEIIPRNPETYNDWRVGDVLKYKYDKSRTLVILSILGDVILVSSEDMRYVYTYTSKFISEKYQLSLTDYERELLKVDDEKKEECPFKKGDRVLARDTDKDTWCYDYFLEYRINSSYPYSCRTKSYKQCIHYNEKTWQLLGTTDDYKE